MMKKVFTLLMVVATSLHVSSQEKKFGKVSVAELTEKSHPADSSASAAYLYKIGSARYEYSAYDGFYLMTIIKARIKIYNKDGYDWSNLAVPYYLGHGNREEVRFSDAATYNLEDGKIVKTKLKNDGEFNENINQYWARKKITMPNVKEGSVIEYEYSIKSNTTELRPFDFQSSIPTNYAEYKTIVPEYFKYNAVQRGFIYPKVTTVDQSRTFEMRIQDPHLTGARNMSRGTQTMKEIQTTYVAENLPAMRDEAYVNNISNYTSGVTHELSVIQFPETAPKLFATDWETVVTKIYENDDFGDELNK